MEDNIIESICYKPSDLPALLGIGRSQAYALVRSDDFPSFHIGKRYIIPKKDLEEWLSKQCKPTLTA